MMLTNRISQEKNKIQLMKKRISPIEKKNLTDFSLNKYIKGSSNEPFKIAKNSTNKIIMERGFPSIKNDVERFCLDRSFIYTIDALEEVVFPVPYRNRKMGRYLNYCFTFQENEVKKKSKKSLINNLCIKKRFVFSNIAFTKIGILMNLGTVHPYILAKKQILKIRIFEKDGKILYKEFIINHIGYKNIILFSSDVILHHSLDTVISIFSQKSGGNKFNEFIENDLNKKPIHIDQLEKSRYDLINPRNFGNKLKFYLNNTKKLGLTDISRYFGLIQKNHRFMFFIIQIYYGFNNNILKKLG